MKAVDLQKPFRLSLDFWAAYALLGIPVLWFAKPWSWELPAFSQIAGLAYGLERVPSRFGAIAVIIANIVFAILQTRTPNQLE